jgi:3',5'-cyclic AMP phosphodiesterase CpdA
MDHADRFRRRADIADALGEQVGLMPLPDIAVIADPHFHDITYRPGGSGESAFRSLADTCGSTRVFNESYPALTALLDDIVRRGILIVVIAGDLSDDGQMTTMASACRLLRRYSDEHDLRFFATPGNHDLYSMHGREHSKLFVNGDGSQTLVTSDPAALAEGADGLVLTQEMHCAGYPQALDMMKEFGFFRRPDFLHWETPFGTDDDLSRRSFDMRSADGSLKTSMVDASYLVEPVEGLWILSIDANVFEPRDGAKNLIEEKSYLDSTDAGWNSMLRNKPFILDWMTDVARRARQQNKRLLAVSHYPLLNPMNGTAEAEAKLLGKTGFVRRSPSREAEMAAVATGVRVHFSGHLHVNDTGVMRDGDDFTVNIAVPSTVSFPPAYKVVSFEGTTLNVETAMVSDVPGFDAAFGAYRSETAHSGADFDQVLEAHSYVDFLERVLTKSVTSRYFEKEWPQELAALMQRLRVGDFVHLAESRPLLTAGAAAASAEDRDNHLRGLDVVADWYRLRTARELAFRVIAPERILLYRSLADRFGATDWPDWSVQGKLAAFFDIMRRYMDGQPSDRFSVDLESGDVVALPLGRTLLRQTGTA